MKVLHICIISFLKDILWSKMTLHIATGRHDNAIKTKYWARHHLYKMVKYNNLAARLGTIRVEAPV